MLGCLISFDVECTTEIATPADVCIAQVRARRIARQAGLGSRRQLEFAIAASEAASSILEHAGTGSLVLRAVVASHAELEAVGRGDGIGDVATPVQANGSRRWSLWGTPSRGSLGLGLGAIHRLCDRVEIKTGSRGTTLRGWKYL
jgi:anti-sigma regulatory factor (Ser/Thr protein kinase)